jgi:uncharacterized protein
MTTINHPRLGRLEPSGAGNIRSTGEAFTLEASPRTDLFTPPDGSAAINNAFRLLSIPQIGDWQFSAHVTIQQNALFDAGVLLVWHGANHWAKLCLEQAPGARPMLVSVVTRGVSDDANGEVLKEARAFVRISRLGSAFAFHASQDGTHWELLRHFSLDIGDDPVELGMLVQSPTGEGCDTDSD